MPEGPEVKVMMGNFAHLFKGKTLLEMELCKESFRKKTKGFDKIPELLPSKIVDCCFKGKCGYINLDNGHAIVIGFGMTGRVRVNLSDAELKARRETKEKYTKHFSVRFVYETDTGQDEVFYNCVRNFGHVWILNNYELAKKLSTIGPCILDPVIAKESIVINRLRKKNNKTICEALMDQSVISGIGNYIKAEILYYVKLHPLTLIKNITDDQLYRLYMEARDLAKLASDTGGSAKYVDVVGGDKMDFIQVYDKATDPEGRKVTTLKTPDKRTSHVVLDVQILQGDSDSNTKSQPKVKVTVKPAKPKPKVKVTVKPTKSKVKVTVKPIKPPLNND